MDTLIIGDVHSQVDALRALLRGEGVIDDQDQRIPLGPTVVQLGDLGDYREASLGTDAEITRLADEWIDLFLLGNHEAPVFGGTPFNGYKSPSPETFERLRKWNDSKRLLLSYATENFLVTHAGLGSLAFDGIQTGRLNRSDPVALSRWINQKHKYRPFKFSGHSWSIRDDISRYRGGWCEQGGLLWRDSREGLYERVRQIFGHTSHELSIAQSGPKGMSYCIDTSKGLSISAIRLPSERIIHQSLS